MGQGWDRVGVFRTGFEEKLSDTQEKWEQDVEWLYAKAATINKRPTADDEEFFCERVGIKTADGISEHDARLQAFKELY